MQITIRPMTVEEAWKYISQMYNYYHNELKHFGYTINHLVPKPNHPISREVFEKETPTDSDIEKYRNWFEQDVYNVTDLTKYDKILKSYVAPMMESGINKFLVPLLDSWNAKMPDELEILCTYGKGASYLPLYDKKAQVIFRMSRYPDNKEAMLNTMLHEFIHLLIEKPIIEKYKVPHNFKERIVDIIGHVFFDRYVQERFINPFVDKYITPDAIKTDLPGAVAKMMTDYNALKQKQMHQGKGI